MRGLKGELWIVGTRDIMRILGENSPNAAMPMQLVRSLDPIADEQRAVWSQSDSDWAEIGVAFDQRFGAGMNRGEILLQIEILQRMDAPGTGDQAAVVFRWKIIGLVRHDRARSFARARDHAQRPRQFAEPSGEGMRAAPSQRIPITVIAAFHDVHQPARRPPIGIVVDRKQSAKIVKANMERIPEANRDFLELAAIGPATKNAATFRAGNLAVAAAVQRVRFAEIFAEAKINIAAKIKSKSR